MWNWSNSSGGLFLQTGNMSEKAVGYTTIGGDLEGALGVLANVPKTVVMALLDYLQEKTGYEGIGLRPGQTGRSGAGPEPGGRGGADALPGARRLLPSLRRRKAAARRGRRGAGRHVPRQYTRDQLRAWVEKFTRLFLGSIYKWVQAPISLHIGNLDLDRERALQLPVVQNREWAAIESVYAAKR